MLFLCMLSRDADAGGDIFKAREALEESAAAFRVVLELFPSDLSGLAGIAAATAAEAALPRLKGGIPPEAPVLTTSSLPGGVPIGIVTGGGAGAPQWGVLDPQQVHLEGIHLKSSYKMHPHGNRLEKASLSLSGKGSLDGELHEGNVEKTSLSLDVESKGDATAAARDGSPDSGWEEEVGGTEALRERLKEFLVRQARAAAWIAGESDEAEAPRILIGHIPNVGLGNQLIAVTGYLAHALLTGRALFFQTATLQCDTTEGGKDGIGATSLSPLCNVFAWRHEGGGHHSKRKQLWHFLSVLDRSRAAGRLERLHRAYPKVLSLTARATPGRQPVFDHLACATDTEAAKDSEGSVPRLVTMKTSLYYTSLLRLNAAHDAEARRLFAPSTGGRAGAVGHPYEAELDAFGPLFRFLLKPTQEVAAEVETFSREFFHRPYGQRNGPSPGMPLILGVHARVQDTTQHHASNRGGDSIKGLEGATKRCARKRSRELARENCGGSCNQSDVRAVVFVAADDRKVRDGIVASLRGLQEEHGVRTVTYSTAGFRHDSIAARGTRSGQFAAAVDLLLLGRADHLVRAGNRGFSSLSGAATATEATAQVESLVVHPCNEMADWKKGYDCVTNLRTQPRMLMRWPLDDRQQEKERVSCPLRDATGVERTMAQRMHAMGSLDQWCEELWEMAEFNLHTPTTPAVATGGAPSVPKTEL